jgi:hypothetical protein
MCNVFGIAGFGLEAGSLLAASDAKNMVAGQDLAFVCCAFRARVWHE